MIRAEEFSVGVLADASPCSLMLPFETRGRRFLIVDSDHPTAIFLDGDYVYRSFLIGDNDHFAGLIFNEIEFYFDHESIFDPLKSMSPPLGSVIRHGRYFLMSTSGIRDGFDNVGLTRILSDHEFYPSNRKVGFARWQVRLRRERGDIILHEIDVREKL